MHNKTSQLFIVEGNIGAGKSTFLNIIKEDLQFDIIHEPTDKWQNIGDDNLLDLFYKDTSRWAYTFQSYAFITRIKAYLDHKKKHVPARQDLLQQSQNRYVQVLERSVYCDRYCFAKNCFESGTMSALEWQIYKEWFSWLVSNFIPKPDGFIYLHTSPQTCYNRLLKRNRSEESMVPLSYLQRLHAKHEDWLVQKNDIEKYLIDVPVLVLECDEEFESNSARRKKFTEKVHSFVSTTIQNKHLIQKNIPTYTNTPL